MSIKTGKKQSFFNISLNVLAFGVQFFIGFYISPLIVSRVGASAYGFIGLANDFVSYAAIIASIFNSVAARFIANAYYKSDYERANRYFNSLIVANIGISSFLGLITVLFIPNIQRVLTVPDELILDVKITFAIVFISYIITLLTLVFTTSTFVTNRTDIQGIRNIIQSILRLGLIIVFLNFISIKIYWIALASLIAAAVISVWNIRLTNQLTPELKIDLKLSDKDCTIELAKAGCWMAFSSISNILIRGLDLTVANVLIGDYEMGILSVARTIPNNVTSVVGTIAPLFTPVFISLYVKKSNTDLINNIKSSIKTMAVILFVPITAFIVFSKDFYTLWQGSLSEEEIMMVTALSTLTVVLAYFNSTTATMAQVSVVVNKLKSPVLVSFFVGLISFVVEIVLIKFTNMGIYAIVIPTTIILILRYLLYNSFYAAWCLDQPLSCFLPETFKTYLSIPVLFLIMGVIRYFLPVSSWLHLIVDVVICCIIGYALMIAIYWRKVVMEFVNKHKRA